MGLDGLPRQTGGLSEHYYLLRPIIDERALDQADREIADDRQRDDRLIELFGACKFG